jgi:hypothetical protein
MKKHSTLILFPVLIVLSLSFTGCKKEKDGDDTPAPKTKTELITKSAWKFDNAKMAGTDISGNAALACYKDNIMVFKTDLSGTIDEGANVCSTPAPATFTWGLQNTEAVLNISAIILPGGATGFTLVSVDEDKLVVSQNVAIPPSPIALNVVLTFKH